MSGTRYHMALLVAVLLVTLVLPARLVAQDSPQPPGPPASGPGSENTPYPEFILSTYGDYPAQYWIWEPSESAVGTLPAAGGPYPVILFLSGCCDENDNGGGAYGGDPWMVHLTKMGYVVIAPIYDLHRAVDSAGVLLKEALVELAKPGHAAIDVDHFAVFGYSGGGTPAIQYAGAVPEGLPVPAAVFAGAPCGGQCGQYPGADLAFPDGLKAIVFAIKDDENVGNASSEQAYQALGNLPSGDRNLVIIETAVNAGYSLLAGHMLPWSVTTNPLQWYGLWKLSDALLACAFTGEWCEYALGNTPEQRYMGTWSDDTPVTELTVIDEQ